jgi:DNA-binding NtrC family response regulator
MITPLFPSDAPRPILILDDEEIVLVALRDTLRREGYEVRPCTKPEQAIQALSNERFSVVVTDQQMPVLTGLEFLVEVKRIQPQATRILISAVLSLNTVIDAINKSEVFRFILKPWVREDLLLTFREAVQRHELIKQNARLKAGTTALNKHLCRLNAAFRKRITRQFSL